MRCMDKADFRAAAASNQAPWASSPSLKDRMTTIKKWLDHCKSNHGDGCIPRAEQIPHRLLEVRGDGKPPRLVLSEQIPVEQQQYTTLSHCWGPDRPICTTLDNVESFSDHIPPQAIPRTFDDAILITRTLGIRFIWIDALCIVQDSTKEWAQEAAKMKDIYSGSVLNIAACDSPESQGGCFPIKSSLVKTFHIVPEDRGPGLLVRLQPGDYRQVVKGTVLSSRGWVLQEQLLSNRIVSCMSDELHWECNQVHETEAGLHFQSSASGIHYARTTDHGSADLDQGEMWRIWMKNFSQRDFTYWEDRLPALAGIAELYQTISGDESLVGLWKRSILEDLLWIRMGQVSPEHARAIGSAGLPSWSWISCPSRIGFDLWQLTLVKVDRLVTVQDHCKLMDFSVEWKGVPFVSSLISASIALHGPAVKATINVEGMTDEYDPPYFKLTISDKEDISCTGQFDREGVRPGEYQCLLLRSRVHQQTQTRREIFLILQARGNKYERVGLGCVYTNDLFANAMEETFWMD
ncbi:hypothetical protein N0V90_002617 [Kalmusia sp. IMI 367209]|nr:hypothetical protein N0V90_002617 [Kalmusia sp. IMI 367209]